MARSVYYMSLLYATVGRPALPQSTLVLSEHGYRVSLDVSDTLIFLGPGRSSLPKLPHWLCVFDAQGQPVDGIPVRFSVEPSGRRTPLQPCERPPTMGARAIFQANTIGVVRLWPMSIMSHLSSHYDYHPLPQRWWRVNYTSSLGDRFGV
jgi:hypothetical protein